MSQYKNIFKTAALGVALAAASQAHASPINVGGVVWDPANLDDYFATDTMYETSVSGVGDVLGGYGKITNINGDTTTFCPGCELTYQFGGFTLTGWNDNNNDNSINLGDDIAFSGGWVNFYVDFTPDFQSGAGGYASAGGVAGSEWLMLAGADMLNLDSGLTGSLFSTITSGVLGSGTEYGSGFGHLNVVGGMAAPNFDTDTQAADQNGDNTDFRFTSSFQPRTAGGAAAGAPYVMFGSNDWYADSIPEPTSLALLGAGLLGMGAAAKRRSKNA